MVNDDDSLLSRLPRLIPGYAAYEDQEKRRGDDRETRAFLARRLGECKKLLLDVGKSAASAGDLEASTKLSALIDRLDLVQTRLQAGVEGYAGWFSQREVDADLLEKVARMDANLVSLVDQIEASIKSLSASSIVVPADFQELCKLLEDRLDRRNEILAAGS